MVKDKVTVSVVNDNFELVFFEMLLDIVNGKQHISIAMGCGQKAWPLVQVQGHSEESNDRENDWSIQDIWQMVAFLFEIFVCQNWNLQDELRDKVNEFFDHHVKHELVWYPTNSYSSVKDIAQVDIAYCNESLVQLACIDMRLVNSTCQQQTNISELHKQKYTLYNNHKYGKDLQKGCKVVWIQQFEDHYVCHHLKLDAILKRHSNYQLGNKQ